MDVSAAAEQPATLAAAQDCLHAIWLASNRARVMHSKLLTFGAKLSSRVDVLEACRMLKETEGRPAINVTTAAAMTAPVGPVMRFPGVRTNDIGVDGFGSFRVESSGQNARERVLVSKELSTAI